MEYLSLTFLSSMLVGLLLLSAFFSGSETGMMAVNRYRMRHLAKKQSRTAVRVLALLARPDRLLGAILIGNTFANILAASLATMIASRLWGEYGILWSTVLLTMTVLIFAEVTPKTLAALYPDRFAAAVSWPLRAMMVLFYPLIVMTNFFSNSLLLLLGIDTKKHSDWELSHEELRTLLNDTGYSILGRNKNMFLRLIDLKKVTVDDIMVPRSEIMGIDLTDSCEQIKQQLNLLQHTRLPIFTDDIDNLHGLIHVRSILPLLAAENFSKEQLQTVTQEPYYVPEGTPLTTQLLNFQGKKIRTAFVVNEYGDIQGLVTLEDILEEVVGEFTTDLSTAHRDVIAQEDGSFLVDGTANVRELNRSMGWDLPINGPKTLNGLILEYLEAIPEATTGCRLSGYPMEIIKIQDNTVKTVRIYPEKRS